MFAERCLYITLRVSWLKLYMRWHSTDYYTKYDAHEKVYSNICFQSDKLRKAAHPKWNGTFLKTCGLFFLVIVPMCWISLHFWHSSRNLRQPAELRRISLHVILPFPKGLVITTSSFTLPSATTQTHTHSLENLFSAIHNLVLLEYNCQYVEFNWGLVHEILWALFECVGCQNIHLH